MSDKPNGYTVDCPRCDDRAWLPSYGPNGSEAPGGLILGLLLSANKPCLCEACGPIPVKELSEKDQRRMRMHQIQTLILLIFLLPLGGLLIWAYLTGKMPL